MTGCSRTRRARTGRVRGDAPPDDGELGRTRPDGLGRMPWRPAIEQAAVRAETRQGVAAGIAATPTMILNGETIVGLRGAAELGGKIERGGGRGRRARCASLAARRPSWGGAHDPGCDRARHRRLPPRRALARRGARLRPGQGLRHGRGQPVCDGRRSPRRIVRGGVLGRARAACRRLVAPRRPAGPARRLRTRARRRRGRRLPDLLELFVIEAICIWCVSLRGHCRRRVAARGSAPFAATA